MATRHGKILSKSFPATMKGKIMENQQVLVGRRIGTVVDYLPQTQNYKVKFLDEQLPPEGFFRFEQLFSLMIQYRVPLDKPRREGNIVATARSVYIPLKWAQWYQAIVHKEVDNHKEIRFEAKSILTIKGEVTIGKVIPIRPRTFTSADVDTAIEEALDLAAQFGFEREIEEVANALTELKLKYVE